MARKKIGFIDLFIDEWHANNYPAWIRQAPRANEFELGYAWEEAPKGGRKPLAEWCRSVGMTPAGSIEEVVEKSDAIFVLAPANPEVHERLAEIPLKCGKPLYIDKPFAPDRAAAKRIIDLAKKSGTPLMTSSALRYSDEILKASAEKFAKSPAAFVATTSGGGNFPEYAIHQLETIVTLMGTGAKSVTQNTAGTPFLNGTIRYDDGRLASYSYAPFFAFQIAAANSETSVTFNSGSHMFETLLARILDFFVTKECPIPREQTLEIAALLDACVKAMKKPGKAIPVAH